MIRTMLQLASAVLVVAAVVALPGCGGSKSPASKTPPAKSGHYEGDGHDHSKDKSDHSGHSHEKEAKTK
jgi:predicted small lipoprotein YifL